MNGNEIINGTVDFEPYTPDEPSVQAQKLRVRDFSNEINFDNGLVVGEDYKLFNTGTPLSLWKRNFASDYACYIYDLDGYFKFSIPTAVNIYTYPIYSASRTRIELENLDTGEVVDYGLNNRDTNEWGLNALNVPAGNYKVISTGNKPLWSEWFLQRTSPVINKSINIDTNEIVLELIGEADEIHYKVYEEHPFPTSFLLYESIKEILNETNVKSASFERLKEVIENT